MSSKSDKPVVSWADFIKELLRIRGWTNEILANELGCSSTAVSRWKNGHNDPSGTAKKLLLQLGNALD